MSKAVSIRDMWGDTLPEPDDGYFDITAELMLQIVKGFQPGELPRSFVVIKDAIPQGASVHRVEQIHSGVVRVFMSGCEPRRYAPTLSIQGEGTSD